MDEEQKKYAAPTIHTLESDTIDMLQNPLASNLAIAEEANAERIKKIRVIIAIGMSVLLIALSLYMYFAFVKKPVPVAAVVEPPRIYKLVDVLPELNSNLSTYTNLATSTENSMAIDIVTFDNIYGYILQNEKYFGQIVGKRFGLGNISEFTDINIQNNDVRIADGETGVIVYGYIEQKKLVIANSVEEWLKIKSNI
jgi:hypothetical protein